MFQTAASHGRMSWKDFAGKLLVSNRINDESTLLPDMLRIYTKLLRQITSRKRPDGRVLRILAIRRIGGQEKNIEKLGKK